MRGKTNSKEEKKGTTIVKTDRVTMASLTAQPATVVSGDWWFRQDLGRPYYAIDSVVANAKLGLIRPAETDDLADSAITTAKIADAQITTAKIVDSAVSTAKIADSAIATAKIVDSAITTAKIVDSAITTGKIADSAVTDAKIDSVSPGKITTGDLNLGTGTLTAGEVVVGDMILEYGWKIRETAEALQFLNDDRVVLVITKSGVLLCQGIEVE